MRIISGEAKGRTIEAPSGRNTRPTLDRVRENIFNMIQGDVPGSRTLDLFAGSGALSLEALSRGAVYAVLADNDRKACETQRKNIDRLGFGERTRILHCDWKAAVSALKAEENAFDLVFLDPPYRMTDLRELFRHLLPLLAPDALIVLEHEAEKSPLATDDFKVVKERSWGFCAATIYCIDREGA